jgi:hypothetical protein
MALGSTQPLREMSTRNLPGGKGQLTTLPPTVSQLSRRCGSLDLSQSYGPSRPVTGIALLFFFTYVAHCGSQATRLKINCAGTQARH